MTMIMVKTHDSATKIHVKDLNVLLIVEVFIKYVIIYAVQQKSIGGIRMEHFMVMKIFSKKICKQKLEIKSTKLSHANIFL